MISIQRRLLIVLVSLWTTLWLAVALITLERSGHEIAELLDAQLAQAAQVLRRIALAGNLPDIASDPQALSPVGHPYESKISIQLWRGGELISTFGGAPDGPLAQTAGFSDQVIADTKWRVYGLPTDRTDEILFVAQSYSIRQELIRFLTVHALQPILWSLPLTVLLIWLAVSDGLRPVQQLTRDIQHLSTERLTPVDEDTVPLEIRPLTNALNGLMERLKQALSAERRFAADASHELRTPLAVIRTYAQLAQRSTDSGEREESLDQLIQGVDRATRLVSQLLTLARLEPDGSEIERGAWSLCDAVAQVVDEKQAAAQAKSIEMIQEIPDGDPCVVAVHPSMLDILVRNLVENAIKYSPDRGWVRIRVETGAEQVILRVADSGPGIPGVEKKRVFERFYRTGGQSASGAGLGLSIVQRICELHGIGIQLLDGGTSHGLLVEMRFPEPADALV